jgi:hypothetical protein
MGFGNVSAAWLVIVPDHLVHCPAGLHGSKPFLSKIGVTMQTVRHRRRVRRAPFVVPQIAVTLFISIVPPDFSFSSASASGIIADLLAGPESSADIPVGAVSQMAMDASETEPVCVFQMLLPALPGMANQLQSQLDRWKERWLAKGFMVFAVPVFQGVEWATTSGETDHDSHSE